MSELTVIGDNTPREMVVISGKGGTGKTSLVASFASLAKTAVLADCDVDAADLHLVLSPTIRHREEFLCGHEAIIRQDDCVRCGTCLERCRFDAVRKTEGGAEEPDFWIDPIFCEGCGVCVACCPVQAVDFPERVAGEWFISDTRYGPMAHARLNAGGENSGKLVSKVREVAREIARERQVELVVVDGPPGVGCPVIACVSGASLVLVVTEPTLSGVHDLRRVLQLTRHFGIRTAVCINKWDLNPALTDEIESESHAAGCGVAGRVRYDRSVTFAQIQGKAVVELSDAASSPDVEALYYNTIALMNLGS